MVRINISEGKDYHTQRNNAIDPMGTCATTSMVMALIYSGVELPDCGDRQQEDVLTEFIRTDPRVKEAYQRDYPTEFKNGVPPNELAPMRALGTNLWIGREVNRFSWVSLLQDVILSIISKKACIMSGVWPYKNAQGEEKGISHVVCVCGFESAQEDILQAKTARDINLDLMVSMIVDDPFGDYRTGYRDPRGNDVIVPFRDFIRITKEQGSVSRKWAHFIL